MHTAPPVTTTPTVSKAVSRVAPSSALSSSLCSQKVDGQEVLVPAIVTEVPGGPEDVITLLDGQLYTYSIFSTLVPAVQTFWTKYETVKCESVGMEIVDWQTSATGFDVDFAPSTTILVDSAGTPLSIPKGWEPPSTPMITPAPSATLKFFSAELQISIKFEEFTLFTGGTTATFGDGSAQTSVHIDRDGNFIVVAGGSTSSLVPPILVGGREATPFSSGFIMEQQTVSDGGPPVTIGSGTTATTFWINQSGQTMAIGPNRSIVIETPTARPLVMGNTTATVLASEYHYIVDSQTLAIDHSVTVEGVVVFLTADGDGTTVLVAGTHSVTLAGPSIADYNVVTKVISGTTAYIVGSKTLEVGHPVTVADVPVYIATVSDHAILVVGNKTRTLGDADPTGDSEKKEGAATVTCLNMWTFVCIGVALAFAAFG